MTLICRLQTLKDQFELYTIQLGTFLIVIKMKFFSGGGVGGWGWGPLSQGEKNPAVFSLRLSCVHPNFFKV